MYHYTSCLVLCCWRRKIPKHFWKEQCPLTAIAGLKLVKCNNMNIWKEKLKKKTDLKKEKFKFFLMTFGHEKSRVFDAQKNRIR